jgi:chemotaxis protein CheD
VPAFQPTRPLQDFQPTRPFNDFQPTRPLTDFQPTRPLADFQPTRPLEGQAQRPAAAAQRGLASAAPVTPPSAEGSWKVRGTPGQHLVLMPGQMHLGQHVASLRTLLGSCVAITLWHPQKRIGGMCHFLLPQRQRRNGEPPDGRYGDEALAEMVRALTALQTEPKDYVAHLYGGADTMSGVSAARFNIGERNIEQGWSLIDRYGFLLDGVDVGEDIPRTVSLTLATGVVAMRRGTGQAPDHLRA